MVIGFNLTNDSIKFSCKWKKNEDPSIRNVPFQYTYDTS